MFMLFEIEKDLLLEGLSKTSPIAEKRSTLPILSHILMEARDSSLILTATDLEVGLQMIYTCTVSEPGIVAVPSKKIHEIVRELAAGPVRVELTETQRIRLKSGESVFELAGMDASDYPAWTSYENVETAKIPAEKLLHMVEKTLFASSSDDARFNLNGVLFEQNKATTRLVATDGHRLALIDDELGLTLPSKQVVPKKGLVEMRRLLENLKEEVQLGFEQKNLFIKTNRFMMTVRLIEGDYPDYRKVIPEGGERQVKVNRLNLIQALKRVAVLTSERNKGVTVQVTPGKMELTAFHPDLGTGRDVVDVDYSHEEFSIIVNVHYLLEALGVVDSDTVSLEFHKEGAPIIIRPYPAKTYFNLVMPMRK
jgi:DNA polymerase-3 subunit beta